VRIKQSPAGGAAKKTVATIEVSPHALDTRDRRDTRPDVPPPSVPSVPPVHGSGAYAEPHAGAIDL
jgi:hypothetical protein